MSKAIDNDISFCRFCGNKLVPGALFCSKCGKKLDATVKIDSSDTKGAPVAVPKPAPSQPAATAKSAERKQVDLEEIDSYEDFLKKFKKG